MTRAAQSQHGTSDSSGSRSGSPFGPSHLGALAIILLIALAVGLRVVAPGSDPYPSLDWSAGLLTDEGFYIHNARNVALFGHPRTDGFNNMLLSPLLHYAQVGVFAIAGCGSAQARCISMVTGLLSVLLLWAVMARTFGARIAATAALFLGLDHVFLLFNRMALMDTPATMLALAAFDAFTRGVKRGVAPAGESGGSEKADGWLLLCGMLMGAAVVNRSLCIYLLPVPFLALWARGAGSGRRMRQYAAVAGGMAAVLLVYAVAWYIPNRAEIEHMARTYRVKQIQPHSFSHLVQNIYHAFLGDTHGVSPYLFRHTPVLLMLTLAAIAARIVRTRAAAQQNSTSSAGPRAEARRGYPPRDASGRFLIWWFVLGFGMLAVSSYSPSRYYVPMMPALAGLAAIALWQLPPLWAELGGPELRARLARGALSWFFAFHLLESALHRERLLPRGVTTLILYAAPTVLAFAAALLARQASASAGYGQSADPEPLTPHAPRFARVALALWLVVNCAWLGDWLRTLSYSQYETSLALARTLPEGCVLLGDIAPGVCLDNRFVAVCVLPGLSNDDHPVERFAPRPRAIVIVESPLKPIFWLKYYAPLIQPDRLAQTYRVLRRWDVEVYPVR